MERRLARGLDALLGRGAAAGATGSSAPAPSPASSAASSLASTDAPAAESEAGSEAAEPSKGGSLHAVHVVPLDRIRANPRQPRREFDESDLAQLRDSIEANGLLQPIVVRRVGDGYELIAGERRFRACKALGHRTIPAVVRPVEHDQQLVLALVENLQRRDLNGIDEALAYRQLLVDFGLTHEDVATRVGRERSTVTNILRLLELPEELREKVSRGTLSVGHARALLPLLGSRRLGEAVAQIEADGWSVRRLEAWVRETATPAAESSGAESAAEDTSARASAARTKDAVLVDFEDRLREAWGVPVRIRKRRRGAELTFECGSDAELSDLLVRLSREPSRGLDAF